MEFTYSPSTLGLLWNQVQNLLTNWRLPDFKFSPQWARKNKNLLLVAGILLLLLLVFLFISRNTPLQENNIPNQLFHQQLDLYAKEDA
jgi:hypothetical protein